MIEAFILSLLTTFYIDIQIPNEKTAQMSFTTKLFLRFLRQLLDNTRNLLSCFVKGGMLDIIRSTLFCIFCIVRACVKPTVWEELASQPP